MFVLIGVTACNKIQIYEEVFKAKHSFLSAKFFVAMCHIITAFANIIHPFPNIRTNYLPIFLCIHQALQIVLIGHFQFFINGIHPFYGKFHGSSAIDNAGFRVYKNNFFSRYGNICKG